jgi:hypothetical protein
MKWRPCCWIWKEYEEGLVKILAVRYRVGLSEDATELDVVLAIILLEAERVLEESPASPTKSRVPTVVFPDEPQSIK